MHVLKIEIVHKAKKKVYELAFPENFADLNKKHFLTFCKWIHKNKTDELWFQKLKRDFIGMKRRHVMALNDLHAAQLDSYLAFLGEPYINHKSLLSRIGILRGPQDRLKNFTIQQMSYVDSYAMAYHADEKKIYLDSFFAAAYSLPFLPFSKKLIDFNTFLFRLVSTEKKKAALHNFLGLRAFLVKDHPNTFEGGDENTGMEKFGWRGTINNLAGPKFGSLYRAQRTLIPDAFLEFELNSIKIKRMEKQREKALKK
jgi:hypothetical protein